MTSSLNINIDKLTIGSDPEFGVQDAHGNPRSVINLLGGTKDEPLPLNDYVSCQEDNVGAEICIPPCRSAEDYVRYIEMGRQLTQERLQQQAPGYKLVSVSSQRYNEEELGNPVARKFGCEPSYDIHNGMKTSQRPSAEEVGNLRSFGFHVHVGYQCDETRIEESIMKIIASMDLFLGVPSLILDQDLDRRRIYGNPGDFRFKKLVQGGEMVFIVEYRTLGAGMHSSPERITYVYNQTIKAVEFANQIDSQEQVDAIMLSVRSAFREANAGILDAAENVMERYGVELLQEEVVYA